MLKKAQEWRLICYKRNMLRVGDGATFVIRVDTARLSRPRRRPRDVKEQSQDGATIQTKAETARPRTNSSRPCWKWRGCRVQSGDGATFQTMRRLRDFPDRGGDGPSKKQFFVTIVEAVRIWRSEWRLSRPRLKRRDFPDQSADGATIQTKAQTARLLHQSRDGPTIQTTAEMARSRTNLSRPWWKR